MHRKLLFSLAMFLLCGVSAGADGARQAKNSAAGGTETVVTTFRVKPGKEEEFLKVLNQAWPLYRRFKMVVDKPHLILRGEDDAHKTYFIEIFTWKDHEAPDNAPDEVAAVWSQMNALCEKRDGHAAIEFPEVAIVTAE